MGRIVLDRRGEEAILKFQVLRKGSNSSIVEVPCPKEDYAQMKDIIQRILPQVRKHLEKPRFVLDTEGI